MPMEQVPLVRVAEDFETFFRREYRPVLGLAIVLCGNQALAEELTQEAFMAALRQWDRVGGYERPEAWVRRVVANQSVSRFRRRMAEAKMMVRLGHPRSAPVVDVADSIDVWSEVRRLPRRQAAPRLHPRVVGATVRHPGRNGREGGSYPRPDYGYVGWSPDGEQLFASTYAYGESILQILRYRFADQRLDTATLPFGGALDFVVIDEGDADLYLDSGIDESCPAPGGYPSNRQGICTFEF